MGKLKLNINIYSNNLKLKKKQKAKIKLQEKIRNKMIDDSTKSLIMLEING